MKRLLRVYIFLAGSMATVIAVATTAVLLLGVVDHRALVEAIGTAAKEPPAAPETAEAEPPLDAAEIARRTEALKQWDLILEKREARIAEQTREVEAKILGLERSRASLRRVLDPAARLVAALAPEEKVSLEGFADGTGGPDPAQVERLVGILTKKEESARGFPGAVARVKAMDARAAARIFAGGEGKSEVLPNETIIRFLGQIDARRSGEILAELARVSPERAARILQEMAE